MKIIISPAKKMKIEHDVLPCTEPFFNAERCYLVEKIKQLSLFEMKNLMKCNDSIAQQTFDSYQQLGSSLGTPALLAYDGIQYKYMAPTVFEQSCFDYLQQHLVILSALYGALKPFDAVEPYRLEMQTKLAVDNYQNLYQFWGSKIYDNFLADSEVIIDLASVEYSRAVSRYFGKNQQVVKVVFGEIVGEKIVEKSVYAKMARGEMVAFMAQNNAKSVVNIKKFNRLGYSFSSSHSNENKLVFLKGENR